MSEALERVSGIVHLPVFPLPLVLLPNELLPLHIFEPRYRQMLDDVRAGTNIFGVSYFEPAEETHVRPAIGTVGCAAEIRDVQSLPDGRSNIVTSGLVRYRILDYSDADTPYFSAEVEFFEDEDERPEFVQAVSDEVFALFERIAKAAFTLSGNRGKFPEIENTAPEPLSFLVTAAFNFDNELKYQLLEMTVTSERLKRLKGFLSRAVRQMEANAEIADLSQKNGHSSKKLDL